MTAKALIRSIARACFYTANNIRYPIEMSRLREALGQIGEIGTLLDAGAGGGYYAAKLYAPRCRRLVVVEPWASNFAIARQTLAAFADKTTFIEASIAGMPVADASVDCVTCTQVLEHIEDDNAAVAEFARVLKPGGHALITVPTPPEPWPHDGHVREGYTEQQLTDLFARHGMELRRTDWFMTRDTLRRAKFVQDCGGIVPKLFPLPELRMTGEQRRASGPYCILGLFQKTK
jgi:ubiquinone/menaquinone biosynthesis C-methylase UbiE